MWLSTFLLSPLPHHSLLTTMTKPTIDAPISGDVLIARGGRDNIAQGMPGLSLAREVEHEAAGDPRRRAMVHLRDRRCQRRD